MPARSAALRLATCLVLAVLAAGQDALEVRMERYRTYLARSPHNERALEGLVEAARAADCLPQLVDAYRATVAATPDDAAARIVLARLLAAERRPAEGLLVLDAAADDPRALALAARLQRDTGHLDEALAALRAARALADAGPLADELLESEAELHLARGDSAAAAATYRALADAAPDDARVQLDVAQRLHAAGLRRDAIELYARAAAVSGDDVELFCRAAAARGALLEETSDGAAALACYAEALPRLAADHWLRLDLVGRTLDLHRRAGTLDRAVHDLRALAEEHPADDGWRDALVRALELSGQREEAAAELGRALERAPRDANLALRVARARRELGDDSGWRAGLQRVLQLAPDDGELRYELGLAHGRAGDVSGAEREWSRYCAAAPRDAERAARVARAWDELRQPERAGAELERAVALDPTRARPAVDLARHHAGRGDRGGARATLRAAEGRVAASPGELDELADAWKVLLDEPREALRVVQRALALEPDRPSRRGAQVELQLALGRRSEALAALRAWAAACRDDEQRFDLAVRAASEVPDAQRAEELERLVDEAQRSPDDPVPALFGAALAERARRRDVALSLLSSAVARQPDAVPLRAVLAGRLIAWREVDPALEELELLVERDPARAQDWLAQRITLALGDGEHTAHALQDLGRLRALLPTDPGRWRAMAGAYASLDRPRDVLACYERALALAPDDPLSHLALGRLAAADGARDRALEHLRAAWSAGEDAERQAAMAELERLLSDRSGIAAELRRLRRVGLRNPFDTETPRWLAQLCLRADDAATASAVLADLRRREGDVPDLLELSVRADAAAGIAARSHQHLARLHELGVDTELLTIELAAGYLHAGHVHRALDLALACGAPRPVLDLLARSGEHAAALTLVRRLQRDGRLAEHEALALRADLHGWQGLPRAALRDLDELERLSGADWRLARRMGEVAAEAGAAPRVLREGRRLLELEAPEDVVRQFFAQRASSSALIDLLVDESYDARRDADREEAALARLYAYARPAEDVPRLLDHLDRLRALARAGDGPPDVPRGAWEVRLREWRARLAGLDEAARERELATLRRRRRILRDDEWYALLALALDSDARALPCAEARALALETLAREDDAPALALAAELALSRGARDAACEVLAALESALAREPWPEYAAWCARRALAARERSAPSPAASPPAPPAVDRDPAEDARAWALATAPAPARMGARDARGGAPPLPDAEAVRLARVRTLARSGRRGEAVALADGLPRAAAVGPLLERATLWVELGRPARGFAHALDALAAWGRAERAWPTDAGPVRALFAVEATRALARCVR